MIPRQTALKRWLVGAMFASIVAVVPGMFRAGTQLWAQSGGPSPALDPATQTCDSTHIQLYVWDSYARLWGRRCVGVTNGQPDTVLSGEGDVVALPDGFVNAAAN